MPGTSKQYLGTFIEEEIMKLAVRHKREGGFVRLPLKQMDY